MRGGLSAPAIYSQFFSLFLPGRDRRLDNNDARVADVPGNRIADEDLI